MRVACALEPFRAKMVTPDLYMAGMRICGVTAVLAAAKLGDTGDEGDRDDPRLLNFIE